MEGNHNYKNSKKTILKLIILVLVIFFISICIFVLSKFKYKNVEVGNEEELIQNKLVQNQLFVDFQNGEITTDQYVKYSIYAEYDKSKLNERYSEISDSGNIERLIKKYYNELSDETLQYYVEKVNLNDITFELDKENFTSEAEEDKIGLSNFFVSKAYAKSNKVTNLNKAVLSKEGNFVVWYTTTGDSASDYNTAKKIADGLEGTVSKYDENFDSEYSYSVNFISKGKKYENQLKILENSGIDKSYLESAMQIYLIEYEGSLAKYIASYGKLREIFNKFIGGDENGSIAFPYILIKPSSFSDFERLEQLYNHEMFHHYQYYVLAEKLNKEVGEDEYIIEATANWASALVTNKTTTKGYLNEWAGCARAFSSDFMSKEWANTYGKNKIGYPLYVYLYNYSTKVKEGTTKIIQSIYEKDALKYLQDNSTISERESIQSDISLKNLSQNYTNKNLIVDKEFNSGVIIKQTIKDNVEIDNIIINRVGIDYYKLNGEKCKYDIFLKGNSDSSGIINAYVISEKNSEFKLIDSKQYYAHETTMSVINNKEYDNLYLVIANTSMTEEFKYSFRVNIEKISENENEEKYYTKESNEKYSSENKSKGKYYILGSDERGEQYKAYIDMPEGFYASFLTEDYQSGRFCSLFEPSIHIEYSLIKKEKDHEHNFEKIAKESYESSKAYNIKDFKWYKPQSIMIGDKCIIYDKITYKHEFESYYLDNSIISAILDIDDWQIFCRIDWDVSKNTDGENLSDTDKSVYLTDEEILKRAFKTTFVIEKQC